MIISKEVEVVLGNNVKYWESKGYKIPRFKNKWGKIVFKKGTKILVKVEDLPTNSNVKVLCKCDCCGREKLVKFLDYHSLCTNCYNKTYNHRKKVSKTLTGKFKGSDSPNWKGGLPKCEDCGRKLSNRKAKICVSCFGKRHTGENSPVWNFNKSKLKCYRNKVWNETRKYLKELFEKWDGKDYYTGENLLNFKNCYESMYRTIDHKLSIFYGFINNIEPKEIGKLENLCICSRSTNSKKGSLIEKEFTKYARVMEA